MVRKSASQVVLRKMQLTLHATRRTSQSNGDPRLMHSMSAWSVKQSDVLRPGIVAMRVPVVSALRLWMK